MFIIILTKRVIDSIEFIKYISYILYALIFIFAEQKEDNYDNSKKIMILIIIISTIMIFLIIGNRLRVYIYYFKNILRCVGGICISQQIKYQNSVNRFLIAYTAIELSYYIFPILLMMLDIIIFIIIKCKSFKSIDDRINIPKCTINDMKVSINNEIIEMKDKNCLICLEDFNNDEQVALLKCKHIFHMKCIGKWINRDKMTCPLCRENISSV